MNTLEKISAETIRKNWNNYKNELNDTTSIHYQILWDGWFEKFNIDKDDFYIILFKKFIENTKIENTEIIIKENDSTLILKSLDGSERKEIHKLCDKLGLFHQSKQHPKKQHKKFLYIYKPENWLWEFTEKNPYSEPDEVYKEREKNYRRKIFYCYGCGTSSEEEYIFRSVYIRNSYCGDCLETTSDGGGGVLGDHKFE